ncbi:hypothetical protein HMPREF0281_00517 [Corynebacterium ammoniagenes DSM 20306]|uniref:Uncharacterized protein n=1 Tax=Corynebacterium ammoniagenes DSM 20306 TaxID=649754 RepID=A0ABP2IHL3_CORAM|nr:hypothetical protein HMPREF0281_00517 [Corynebacterium ammoniagenes DSM 20306]
MCSKAPKTAMTLDVTVLPGSRFPPAMVHAPLQKLVRDKI